MPVFMTAEIAHQASMAALHYFIDARGGTFKIEADSLEALHGCHLHIEVSDEGTFTFTTVDSRVKN